MEQIHFTLPKHSLVGGRKGWSTERKSVIERHAEDLFRRAASVLFHKEQIRYTFISAEAVRFDDGDKVWSYPTVKYIMEISPKVPKYKWVYWTRQLIEMIFTMSDNVVYHYQFEDTKDWFFDTTQERRWKQLCARPNDYSIEFHQILSENEMEKEFQEPIQESGFTEAEKQKMKEIQELEQQHSLIFQIILKRLKNDESLTKKEIAHLCWINGAISEEEYDELS